MTQEISRRKFMQASASLVTATTGPSGTRFSAPFAMSLAGVGAAASLRAQAVSVSGPYRALVCLFMQGGSDSHNWVIPTDANGYASYANVRRELAWPLSSLQPLSSTGQAAGRTFGMPNELKALRDRYEARTVAIVANVGPLVRPITLAEYQAGVDVPTHLYSHNDQASTWQSMSPEGARSGWGGRMGDLLMAANQYPVFTAISTAGNAVFLSGSQVTQYQIGLDGPITVGALGNPVFGSNSSMATLRRTLVAGGTNTAQAEYARVMQRAIDTASQLGSAMAQTSVPAIPAIPTVAGGSATLDRDRLARQFKVVAQLISAGQSMGMRRQVFMVNIPGFDSHTDQMRDQPALMARVAQSTDYFLSALNSLGLANNVTVFSASDFGRTLVTNGSGSDHGWGSHHFVAGGAVKGYRIYGTFPETALGTSQDTGSGRLLPTVSVTQYAATLGRWMGLTNTDLQTVLPNIGNFPTTGLDFV